MPTTLVTEFPARVQLELVRADLAALVPATIKTGFIVKQGDVLGEITTGGLFRRRPRTTAAGAGFSNASTVGHVTDNTVFADADVITEPDGTAIGTIAAQGIDAVDVTKVTLTGNAANNVAAGVGVMATDGSQVAKAISNNETDGSGNTPISVFITALLDESKLRGLDASAKSELGGASVAGGVFKF